MVLKEAGLGIKQHEMLLQGPQQLAPLRLLMVGVVSERFHAIVDETIIGLTKAFPILREFINEQDRLSAIDSGIDKRGRNVVHQFFNQVVYGARPLVALMQIVNIV